MIERNKTHQRTTMSTLKEGYVGSSINADNYRPSKSSRWFFDHKPFALDYPGKDKLNENRRYCNEHEDPELRECESNKG